MSRKYTPLPGDEITYFHTPTSPYRGTVKEVKMFSGGFHCYLNLFFADGSTILYTVEEANWYMIVPRYNNPYDLDPIT